MTRALINFDTELNTMIPTYAKELDLPIRQINVEVQKIDGLSLEIFGIVIADFQVVNKLGRVWFFQEIFLLTKTRIKVMLEIPFLTFNNMDINL